MQLIKLLSLGFLVIAGVSAMPAPGNGKGGRERFLLLQGV